MSDPQRDAAGGTGRRRQRCPARRVDGRPRRARRHRSSRPSSGRDALRHLLRQTFAVILLDVNMPGLDGFETAALIRQRPALRAHADHLRHRPRGRHLRGARLLAGRGRLHPVAGAAGRAARQGGGVHRSLPQRGGDPPPAADARALCDAVAPAQRSLAGHLFRQRVRRCPVGRGRQCGADHRRPPGQRQRRGAAQRTRHHRGPRRVAERLAPGPLRAHAR